jgi:predicted dinucleotide-binding enzyme
MRITIIGTSDLARTLARRLPVAGHDVVIAQVGNRVEAEEIAAGAGVAAADIDDAVASSKVVILAMPFRRVVELPPAPFRDRIVVDATDYFPGAGDRVAELDDDSTTSSEVVAAHLRGARLVKISSSMILLALGSIGPLAPDIEPVLVPVAGDDVTAKAVVGDLLVDLGFDPVDIGTLADTRSMQPGSIARAVMTGNVGWS